MSDTTLSDDEILAKIKEYQRAQRQQRADKGKQAAKQGGSWVQNNPVPCFIALVVLGCVWANKTEPAPPTEPAAIEQHATLGDVVKAAAEPITGTPAAAATPMQNQSQTTQNFGIEPRNVCEAEAFKVFPAQYHEEVRITLSKENTAGDPNARGVNPNNEGTDYGCFQINDKYQLASATHPNPPSRWLTKSAIFDPNYNARVAYNIFKSQGNIWKAWYGPCGKDKQGNWNSPLGPTPRCGR